jgi:predicted transcriptional regulator
MPKDEVARFLFEIASVERLGILEAVGERPRKHADLARRLAITGSETSRHLRRLVAAGLVRKNVAGEYESTPLAATLGAGLPFFEVLTTARDFLLTHQVSVLGDPFVERLGEIGHGTYEKGTYQVVAVQERALRAVERRIWVVTEQRFESGIPILLEKAARGADVRVIRARGPLQAERRTGHDVKRNFPVRTLAAVPVFLAVLDDQAGLCLPDPTGKIDMATMLLLAEPVGYRWSEDLFLSLWNRADTA